MIRAMRIRIAALAVAVLVLVVMSWAVVSFAFASTEQSFRFLVVTDGGEPAEGVPMIWISEVYRGFNGLGGRFTKEVERTTVLSGKDGIVEIPGHRFGAFNFAVKDWDLRSSTTWMVDRNTSSQSFRWDVYAQQNPSIGARGTPVPGFDAVFKVLSKQGIANLVRYNAKHKRVRCDGTPTPLRVLGGPSAHAKTAEQADVVITITRPDQEVIPKDLDKPHIAKPLRVPWVLESRTLRFAHFAPDTDLSADYHPRTWTQRLEIRPTHPDHETSQGSQSLRLWAMIPGDLPLVVPVTCRIGLSYDSWDLGKVVYSVNFEVLLPDAPCSRYHPDLLSLGHYLDLAPEISGEAIDARLNPIRAAALAHPFPADLVTTPVLRYDTNPTLPWDWRTLPVLLP